MDYLVLGIMLIINIAGIVEITKKKYPTRILFVVIPLLLLQIGTVLGADEPIIVISNGVNINILAYYFGYFIWSILSTILLMIQINHYDKISEKKNNNLQNEKNNV